MAQMLRNASTAAMKDTLENRWPLLMGKRSSPFPTRLYGDKYFISVQRCYCVASVSTMSRQSYIERDNLFCSNNMTLDFIEHFYSAPTGW